MKFCNSNNNNSQRHNSNHNSHLNRSNSFNNIQPNFPRGPVNLPRSRQEQTNFPTNTKVFGAPPNVFRPRNNQNFPRPTPMSISNRNTNNTCNFAQTSRPNFVSNN